MGVIVMVGVMDGVIVGVSVIVVVMVGVIEIVGVIVGVKLMVGVIVGVMVGVIVGVGVVRRIESCTSKNVKPGSNTERCCCKVYSESNSNPEIGIIFDGEEEENAIV